MKSAKDLSSADIIEIRRRYRAGYTQERLAKQYGVDQSTISRIVNKILRKDA